MIDKVYNHYQRFVSERKIQCHLF